MYIYIYIHIHNMFAIRCPAKSPHATRVII